MTTGPGDVVSGYTATSPNVASTDLSGLTSPVNRAVFNTTSMRELAEAMTEPPDPGSVNRRWGIIAAYHGPPDYTVDVTIGGILVPGLAYDAAYTPTVNEVVMLDVVGTDTVVIGTTAPGQWRTGEIEPTFLSAPKSGALFCQGQTLDRTTYANLWSWITANGLSHGKPFGDGNGSTTFTLPDLRGRTPIGAGTLGTDTYAVGDLPGAARVTLATAQMPAHNHGVTATATTTVTPAAHTHSFSAGSDSQGSHTHGGTTDFMSANWNHNHNIPASFSTTAAHTHAGAPGSLSEAANPNNGANTGYFVSGTDTNHQHGFTTASNGGHTHSISGTTGSTAPTASATTTVSVSQTTIGGSTPVDIRQPAFVVNWLIYV